MELGWVLLQRKRFREAEIELRETEVGEEGGRGLAEEMRLLASILSEEDKRSNQKIERKEHFSKEIRAMYGVLATAFKYV